jgi:predicted naringenin-chalcone synthase
VRHTTGVLRDYGNLSSGSFLFSYERLLRDAVTMPGDYGVFMTMGPGSTIETALVQWLPNGGRQRTTGPPAPAPTVAISCSG